MDMKRCVLGNSVIQKKSYTPKRNSGFDAGRHITLNQCFENITNIA